MKPVRLILLALFGLSAAGIGLWWAFGPSPTSTAGAFGPGAGTVEFVVDGDTVDLIIEGEEERVRLIGIDTPESVSRDTPVQCYGAEASAALKGLLPVGSTVRIERDAEIRDRFGRILLYLYRDDQASPDGELFVNEWLVANGFADTLFFEPNTTYRSTFTSLRNSARDAGLGLWGACDGPDQPLS